MTFNSQHCSNIKILESLAHGRTCVTTTFSLRALRPHFDGRHDILAADNDVEMVNHCLDLLRNPERRECLARAGSKIVESAFSHAVFQGSVREGVERSLAEAASKEARL
jgi:hypothetical protein